MDRRRIVRTSVFAVGAVALATAAAVAVPYSASAATTCAATTPVAIQISSSICEIRITTSGTYTFPTAITKLSAVLVGGGGGGTLDFQDGGYAGDGGAVQYIDTVTLGTPIDIAVGAGGIGGTQGSLGTAGSHTSVGAIVANGGDAQSGEYGGTGAAGAPSGSTGGAGYLLENIPGVDATLLPAGSDPNEYGRGGDGYLAGEDAPSAEPTAAQTTPGDGGQGILTTTSLPTAGEDGIVILRFAPQGVTPPASPSPSASAKPGLATTGVDAIPGLISAALLIAGGALMMGLRRRRTPRAR